MTPQELAAAVSDVVQDHVRLALAPVQERLAVAESRLAALSVAEKSLGDLRDRVVTVETKAAQPMPTAPVLEAPAPVDLAPVLERVAAAEARLSVLGDLRDRVVTVETKAATPNQPDAAFYELRERVSAIETKAAPVFDVPADVLSRITALEARPVAVHAEKAVDLTPVVDRLSRLEIKSAETVPVLAAVADLTKDVGAMRERIAVVEIRAQVPGPPGKDGKDGADGLGFDDLSVDFDEDRTIALKFERGSQVKTFPIRFPFMRQQGVWIEGRTYVKGDVVTFGGSQFHCNEETTTRPEASKAWTLIVKRGRDGRDGKDAVELPVVKVS